MGAFFRTTALDGSLDVVDGEPEAAPYDFLRSAPSFRGPAELYPSASAAAGRVPRRACDWARTEMQSAAGACIAARIASLPGRGAARVRTNQKITAAR
jgi:hypothetical protein